MSKTIEKLFEEIAASDEKKAELTEVLKKEDKEELRNWVNAQDCDASLTEIKEYLLIKKEELEDTGELSPEQLEQAAGGTLVEVTIIATIGVGTAVASGIVVGIGYLINSVFGDSSC